MIVKGRGPIYLSLTISFFELVLIKGNGYAIWGELYTSNIGLSYNETRMKTLYEERKLSDEVQTS